MEGIGIGVFEPDIGNMHPSKDGKWVSLSAHKSCVESLQAELEAERAELKKQYQIEIRTNENYTHAREQYLAISDMYSELLHAVESKHNGETRHETALKYIKQAENSIMISKDKT